MRGKATLIQIFTAIRILASPTSTWIIPRRFFRVRATCTGSLWWRKFVFFVPFSLARSQPFTVKAVFLGRGWEWRGWSNNSESRCPRTLLLNHCWQLNQKKNRKELALVACWDRKSFWPRVFAHALPRPARRKAKKWLEFKPETRVRQLNHSRCTIRKQHIALTVLSAKRLTVL